MKMEKDYSRCLKDFHMQIYAVNKRARACGPNVGSRVYVEKFQFQFTHQIEPHIEGHRGTEIIMSKNRAPNFSETTTVGSSLRKK